MNKLVNGKKVFRLSVGNVSNEAQDDDANVGNVGNVGNANDDSCRYSVKKVVDTFPLPLKKILGFGSPSRNKFTIIRS